MPPLPTPERPPGELSSYWSHFWCHCRDAMKEQGTWSRELKPLLDEYVYALVHAEQARERDEATNWDRHSKRAHQLAHTLILTPEARKRHGIGEADQPADPLAEFDELAARRRVA